MSALLFGKPVQIEKNTALPFALDAPLREALYYASLAPSSHNTQMWKVTARPNQSKLEIRLDRSRILRAADPQARESYISLGAFLENLCRALEALGYTAELQISGGSGTEELTAAVSYAAGAGGTPDSAELALMEKRRTDKRVFSKREIPAETAAKLMRGGVKNAAFYPAGTAEWTYLSEGTARAMEIQSARQAARDELSGWLRFSDRETLEKKDGLPAEQLGMSGLQKTFYYLFLNHEAAKGDSYAKQGVDLARKQASGCAGFFVLTGGGSPAELIRTGMRLEAFWLEAARMGVSLHPMSQMLEEEPFRSEISGKLGLSEPVQMLLRAGYADGGYGENSKIRREPAAFVTDFVQ